MTNIIKCTGCGATFDSSLQKCFKCGFPYSPNAPEKPKCPHCGSMNWNKISLKNKVGAGALFGVFAIGHIAKTFKCNNCGYKW